VHEIVAASGALSALFILAAPAFTRNAEARSPPATKPAHLVAGFKLNDPETIKPYWDQVEATFKPYPRHILRNRKDFADVLHFAKEGFIASTICGFGAGWMLHMCRNPRGVTSTPHAPP
jgi:hypothetical protein